MSENLKTNEELDGGGATQMFISESPGLGVAKMAAASAHDAIRLTKEAATSALGALDGKVEQAVPALKSVASKINSAARSGMETVKEAREKTYESARAVKAGAVGYVRREPGKGLMISAALGAVFMAMMSWRKRASPGKDKGGFRYGPRRGE